MKRVRIEVAGKVMTLTLDEAWTLYRQLGEVLPPPKRIPVFEPALVPLTQIKPYMPQWPTWAVPPLT